MKSIKKILIANRGEISVRVARTCKKMGIESVSIYTDSESSYPHVDSSDFSVCLGSGSLQETYLNIQKIVDIAISQKVDAVHPGYGFLSENAQFAEALEKANIKLIGPSTYAMEAMGDKKRSKEVLQDADIPLIPGYHGDDQSEELLEKEANKIGFPVLIKATAGGGGKGMRIVESGKDFKSHLESAKREALNAFNNDRVLLEKFIQNPRHIEVQVMSDQKGNHFHLFERECSIQRRYQKIIEETPSVALDQKLREKICQTAAQIAKHISYEGAGTVEFILDDKKNFYFLEMNTRLQVEHPITEMITGKDLVELQIRVARGESLKDELSNLKSKGHAIEARIYAENPDNSFLPTVGRIEFIGSLDEEGMRLDSGYVDGNEVGVNFDPMCAKLIAFDQTRELAIKKLERALLKLPFLGLKTNREYLLRVLEHSAFLEGKTYTHFIDSHKEDLSGEKFLDKDRASAIASYLFSSGENLTTLWGELRGIRLGNDAQPIQRLMFDDELCEYIVSFKNGKRVELIYNEKHYEFSLMQENSFRDSNGKEYIFWSNGQYFVVNGIDYKISSYMGESSSSGMSKSQLKSPMPGKILKVFIKEGDRVEEGQALVVMEAMKMEHTISATLSGVVDKIFCQTGELIPGEKELVALKEL